MKPNSCHGSQLAKATTTNKKALKDFTKEWTSNKQSYYGKGIEEAFSYFDKDEMRTYGDARGTKDLKIRRLS
jgi:hypothetical protein